MAAVVAEAVAEAVGEGAAFAFARALAQQDGDGDGLAQQDADGLAQQDGDDEGEEGEEGEESGASGEGVESGESGESGDEDPPPPPPLPPPIDPAERASAARRAAEKIRRTLGGVDVARSLAPRTRVRLNGQTARVTSAGYVVDSVSGGHPAALGVWATTSCGLEELPPDVQEYVVENLMSLVVVSTPTADEGSGGGGGAGGGATSCGGAAGGGGGTRARACAPARGPRDPAWESLAVRLRADWFRQQEEKDKAGSLRLVEKMEAKEATKGRKRRAADGAPLAPLFPTAAASDHAPADAKKGRAAAAAAAAASASVAGGGWAPPKRSGEPQEEEDRVPDWDVPWLEEGVTKFEGQRWPPELERLRLQIAPERELPRMSVPYRVEVRTVTDHLHPCYGEKGVFALDTISERKPLGEYSGEVVRQRTDVNPERSYIFPIVIETGGETSETGFEIDARYCGNHIRFMNDFRGTGVLEPNAYFSNVRGHIVTFTRRTVFAGEEFVVDYGDAYWSQLQTRTRFERILRQIALHDRHATPFPGVLEWFACAADFSLLASRRPMAVPLAYRNPAPADGVRAPPCVPSEARPDVFRRGYVAHLLRLGLRPNPRTGKWTAMPQLSRSADALRAAVEAVCNAERPELAITKMEHEAQRRYFEAGCEEFYAGILAAAASQHDDFGASASSAEGSSDGAVDQLTTDDESPAASSDGAEA